jgi:hypothetical protein
VQLSKNESGKSVSVMAIEIGVHGNRNCCLHFNCFAVQQIWLVFVLADCIENCLLQHSRARDNLGMKNIPILINHNCHYNCTGNPSGHWNTWTDNLSFVDEQLFRDSRRNLYLVWLRWARICLRLREQTGNKKG